MDLVYNRKTLFTRWAVESGALSSPLVLVDVGVNGGIHPRWRHLRNRLEVHGFDPLAETIAPLKERASQREHYYAMALGGTDEERDLFVARENTASSFYPHGPSRLSVSSATAVETERRVVSVRSLDGLVADGRLPPPHFIKLDCEGFEPEVLRGAQTALSSVIGLQIEASFNVSETLPAGNYEALSAHLIPRGFRLYDLAFNRVPRASFVGRAKSLRIKRPHYQGRPATLDLLFMRDTPPSTPTELLQRVIVLELYGMLDAAYDLLVENESLAPHVARNADMLIRRRTMRETLRPFVLAAREMLRS